MSILYTLSQIRVKCLGTIEAEFWESDSDTILQGEKLVRVLKVLESQWPGGRLNLKVPSDLRP